MKKLNKQEIEAQKIIADQIINAIDMLQKHFQKYCDEVAPMYNGGQKVTVVPMAYIDQSVKIFKANFINGVNESNADKPDQETVAEEAPNPANNRE